MKRRVSLILLTLLMLAAKPLPADHSEVMITAISWPEKITPQMRLGKQLFFDTKLSKNDQISCASCHEFTAGGSVPIAKPTQFIGSQVRYNPSSIFNLNLNYKMGWIGHIASPTAQLNRLVSGKKVMGLSWEELQRKLRADSDYVEQFEQVYGQGITKETISDAIVSYENALTTPAAFDRYLEGDSQAISKEALKGYDLFQRYGCIACHQGQNVGGNLLQKIGAVVPYHPDLDALPKADLGRYNFTGVKSDIQVFRVPSLRNVAQSAPYLHDGSISELSEVVRLMAKHQLGRSINDADVQLIIAFLQSLSGSVHPELMP